jgi:hypothetical protein
MKLGRGKPPIVHTHKYVQSIKAGVKIGIDD